MRIPHLLACFELHKIITMTHNSPVHAALGNYLLDEDSAGMDALDIAVWKRDLPTIKALLDVGFVPSVSHATGASRASTPIFKKIFSPVQVRADSAMFVQWLSCAVFTEDEQLLATVIRLVTNSHSGLCPIADQKLLQNASILGLTGMLDQLLTITDLSAEREGPTAETIAVAAEVHQHDALSKLMAAVGARPSQTTASKTHLINALTNSISNDCPFLTSKLIAQDNMFLRNSKDRTPLIAAAEFGNIAILPMYLQTLPPGFSFTRPSPEIGILLNRVLHAHGSSAHNGYPLLDNLLARGARISFEHFGMKMLHEAARLKKNDLLEVLLKSTEGEELEKDIDRRIKTPREAGREGMTPLSITAARGW